ncbi:hypothetical protein DL769_006831 [Monosporascus sp. CRB-8-3]|nr:hypothetical protein DL769_006831 [Monosporascus sp. CRB-8-3]
MPPASRLSLIDSEVNFTIPDEEMLELIQQNFYEELVRLNLAYSIRDSNVNAPLAVAPSGVLYELNTTKLVEHLSACPPHDGYIMTSNDTFVGREPESVRLTRQSFDWIRARVNEALCDAADLTTLIISVVIDDPGKDLRLASD